MPLQTAMQCLHTASISNATKQGEKLVANAISHMLQTMVLTEGGFLEAKKNGGEDDKNSSGGGGDGGRPVAAPGRKRKTGGTEPNNNKKMKIDSSKVKSIDEVKDTTTLVEAQLLNAKVQGVSLVIKPQSKCYIMNTGTQVATLKSGLILCGYGKGKWALEAAGVEKNPAKDILFKLESSDDLVYWKQLKRFLVHM